MVLLFSFSRRRCCTSDGVCGPFGVTQLSFVQNQKQMMDGGSFFMSTAYFANLRMLEGNSRIFMQIYDRVCFCNLCVQELSMRPSQ